MASNCLSDLASMASGSSTFDKSANDECRLCFSDTKSDFLKLFQSWAEPWEDMAPTIAEDLYRLANIHVTELDIHSKVICCKCYIKLREACQFVRYIQKNNSMLKHKVMNNEFKLSNIGSELWPKPIEVSKNVNDIINNQNVEIEIKKEVITEEEDNVNNGYPELEIKIEPEELQEQDSRSVKDQQNFSFSDSDSRYFEPEFLDNTLKENKEADVTETEVPETQDLFSECMLCSKSFKSISGLKAHVVSQHSYKSVKRKPENASLLTPERKKRSHVCAICRRSFLTPTDLMVHETWHNKTVCFVCNSYFNSFEELSKHRRNCTGKRDTNKFVSLGDALARTSVTAKELNKNDARQPERNHSNQKVNNH